MKNVNLTTSLWLPSSPRCFELLRKEAAEGLTPNEKEELALGMIDVPTDKATLEHLEGATECMARKIQFAQRSMKTLQDLHKNLCKALRAFEPLMRGKPEMTMGEAVEQWNARVDAKGRP